MAEVTACIQGTAAATFDNVGAGNRVSWPCGLRGCSGQGLDMEPRVLLHLRRFHCQVWQYSAWLVLRVHCCGLQSGFEGCAGVASQPDIS